MLYTTYKYSIFIYQSVNIWEGYCLGRHLRETDPEGTPNSARAAAEHLIASLMKAATALDELTVALASGITNRIRHEEKRVEQIAQRLPMLFSVIHTHGLLRIEQLEMRMSAALHHTLVAQKHRLDLMEKIIEGASPMQILQRGYSITRCNGHVVRNASDLPEGSVLTTILADGEVRSVVRNDENLQGMD